MSTFRSCALAYRYSSIDRIEVPPTPWMAKGTLVHRALERLYDEVPQGQRSPAVARHLLRDSVVGVLGDDEHAGVDVGDVDEFVKDAEALVANLFLLEDPDTIRAVGLELKLEATMPGGAVIRGVIDRLDLLDDGSLVVVDYKTGTAPSEAYEKERLGGVQMYAHLVEVTFGVVPARVELLHLREPVAISSRPSPAAHAQLLRRTDAIWRAITTACDDDAFEPNTGPLCGVCAFGERCPAFAPERAHAPGSPSRLGEAGRQHRRSPGLVNG